MGVHGLWQLLSSTGKPVPLESLEGKVLAVDVSVWLHQLSKGMRDSSGNPVANAHLHGLFTRICKLLYYRIKPIFVFDGGVPALKKQTLASRRNKREDAERTSTLMQQKILTNLIRGQVLKEAYGLDKLPEVSSTSKSSSKGNKEAIFELPPVPESSQEFLQMRSSEDKKYNERRELQKMVESNYEDINAIDVESEDFKCLPLEIQHEIINDIRFSRKNYNLAKITELPEEAQDFSSYQMKKILKHSKLTSRQDILRKELNERQTKKLSLYYGKTFDDYDEVMSQRVMSEDSAHYLLAKKSLTKKSKEEDKLVKGYLGAIEEETDNIVETGCDMLLDSDDDNVDILEESKLIFDELSENKGGHSEFEKGGNPEFGKGSHSDIDLKNVKGKSCLDSERRSGEVKSRLKAVIEIESDSDKEFGDDVDDITVDAVKVKKHKMFEPCLDDTEDQELQMAIELSLKETGLKEAGNKYRDASQGSSAKPALSENSNHVTSLVDEEVTVDKSDEVKERKSKEGKGVKGRKLQGKGDDVKSKYSVNVSDDSKQRNLASESKQKTVNSKSIKSNNKADEKSAYFKQSDKGWNKTNNNNNRTEARPVPKSTQNKEIVTDRRTNTLFKRRISCMSSDSTDSTENDRNIKVINLSDDENVDDSNLQEDSSQSEDDFIEVKVDLTNVVEDDLFPASMFDTISADALHEPLSKKPKLESDSSSEELPLSTRNEKTSVTSASVEKAPSNEDDIKTEATSVTQHDDQEIKSSDKIDEDIPVTLVTGTDDDESSRLSDNDEDTPLDDDNVAVSNGDSDDNDKRPPSPRVTNLALQFESVNEQKVKDMSVHLREENRQLRLEQGRQERLAMSITNQTHSEAQELLQLFGIPYIVSPTEAEAQCAQLELSKQSHGTITDDSDIWLFGGKCVFKNFFNQQKHVECFKVEHITTNLGLSRESLINIALLCGSDYTEGIRGVGPVTAMEIMARFPGNGLEGLRKFKSWWEKAQNQLEIPVNQSKFLAKLKDLDVRNDFPSSIVVEAYLSPTVDDSCDKCTWSLPDVDLLRQYASEKLKWNKSKTDEVLLPVMKRLADKQTQRGIMSYFQPETFIQPTAVKSKRLQKVVNQFVNPDADNIDEPETGVDQKSNKKGRKRKVTEENASEGTESAPVKRTRKGGKKKDSSDKSNAKKTEAETELEVITDSAETIEHSVDIDLVNSETGKDTSKVANTDECGETGSSKYFKGGKKCAGDINDTEIDKINGRQGTKKRITKTINENSNKNKRGKDDNVKSKRSEVFENSEDTDSDNRSSVDSSTDSESVSSCSDDDERVVTSGLNVEEILGLKMGCAMDEVNTVGSELDVQEILNLKMGCKLDEITEGNDSYSKSESRVYKQLVNVNEILHLDSGTDQFLSNTDQGLESDEVSFDVKTDKNVVEVKSDKKEIVPIPDDMKLEEETTADMNVDIDYTHEGGFIKEDDVDNNNDDVNKVDNDGDDNGCVVKNGGEHNGKTFVDNQYTIFDSDIVDDIRHSDNVNSDGKNSYSDKNKKPRKVVDKVVPTSVVEPSRRSTRNRNIKSSCKGSTSTSVKQKTSDSSNSMKKVDEVKTEPMEVDTEDDKRDIATTSGQSVDADTKSKNNKTDKPKPKNVKNKTTESSYNNDPLKQIVTGLPWADRKKSKRKPQSSKTKGLKLVPKETIVKSEKKQAPLKSIGCVNLSESDSDS